MERKPSKTRTASTARAGSRNASERPAPAPPPPALPPESSDRSDHARTDFSASEENEAFRHRAQSSDLRARIQERAYFIFASRGYQHGQALDHWLEAERQLVGGDKRDKGRAPS